MNVTDNDGDTPLYVVENEETARYLVEHGAAVGRRNHEGVTVRSNLYIPVAETIPDASCSLPRTLPKTFLTSPVI